MNERGQIVDWQDVHVRLERTQKAIHTGGVLPQEEIARILNSRALALAAPPEDAAPATQMISLLIFTLSGDRFGIETTHILEALDLQGLISVPCTPTFVVGVVNYKGRILTVLDLRRLLGLSGEGVTKGSKIVSVEAGDMTFGIAVDAVGGIMLVSAHKVTPPPEALTGPCLALTRGITEELITILDLDALARAPAILVNEQVG